MKILYVTAYPDSIFSEYAQNKVKNLIYAPQKFNSTFIKGFKNIGCEIEVLCPSDLSDEISNRKTRFSWKHIKENDISYHFAPTSSNRYVRKIIRDYAIKSYVKNFFKDNNDGIVLIDSLSTCASLIHQNSKRICHIVTDVSNEATEHDKHSSLYSMLQESNYLVLLSEQMKDVIDTSRTKGIAIVNGVADSSITRYTGKKEKVILYSGTLNESNGITNLIHAFKKLDTDYELHFYGVGESVKTILDENKLDSRIQYKGSLPTEQIVSKQQEALILVNPRPINQFFTPYSFPSKLIEYLASGTATISTKLPCITDNYYDVLKSFENDTVDGLYEGLNRLIQKSENELIKIGYNQQKFVLENLSNTVQAQKVIDMINNN